MGDDTNAEMQALKAYNEWLLDELAATPGRTLDAAATDLELMFPKSDTVASIAVWLKNRAQAIAESPSTAKA
jgi:hypothetical protein